MELHKYALPISETFNDIHNVEALVGVEAVEAFGEEFGAGRQRFPFQTTPIISYLDAGNQGTSSNYGRVHKQIMLYGHSLRN